jgi:hypothetical protein
LDARQSTRALRQARAGSKGEARVHLRSARSDLQYLIKNFRKKYLFLCLRCDFRHGIGPFVAPPKAPSIVTARRVSLVRGGLYLHQFTRLSWRSGGDDQIALLRRSGI